MYGKFVLCFFVLLGMALSQEMDCDKPEVEGPIFYPHPTNCSLFYECAHGEAFLMECWPGLHFNPEINVCDYPNDAGCEAEG